MINRIILLVLLAVPWQFAAGIQEGIINDNKVYRSNIKTVLLHKAGFEMSAPVIGLNSDEKLELSFDDLDGDLKPYKFTVTHCNAEWFSTQDLISSDYISGFSEDQIDDFTYSYNTTVSYTHYSLLFPTDNMGVKISGNYILTVYDDEPAAVVFIRRFMVVESTPVSIVGKVHQAASSTDRFTRQEVDFEVFFNGMPVSDPAREIKVVVSQNDRWDNAIRNLKPRFVRSGSLDFNYDDLIIFNGANEFRAFDTKSLLYQSERIRKIEFDTSFNVYLLDDIRRTTKNWIMEKDINGRMFIKNEEQSRNSDTEADYAWIHFFLPCDPVMVNGEVFILGGLTGWQFDENSKMRYNPFKKGYEKKLFLKQGYYNYLYVFKESRKNMVDEAVFEGSHWETENEYTIWVYYRGSGGLYDRLIALQNLLSNQ